MNPNVDGTYEILISDRFCAYETVVLYMTLVRAQSQVSAL